MKHRLVLSAAAAAAMMVAGAAAPARAQELGQYPWCSQYQSPSTARSCSYTTHSQCMQTVSGIGGYCFRNPDYGYGRGRRDRY
jgi:hypothetical protein